MDVRRLGRTAAVAAAFCGAAAGAVWADEVIEMATYIPTPTSSETAMDRLHTRRATIGDNPPLSFSLSNPANPDPPNGTLLVSGKVGIGTAAPEAVLDANGLGRFRGSGPVPTSGAGLELYYIPATEGLIGGWVSAIDRGAPAYKDLFLSGSSLLVHTSGSERMRVDSSGKVGIGTASPQTMLHVRIPDELTLGEGITVSGPVPRFALVERWTGLTGGLGMASFADNYGVGTLPGDISLYAQGGGRLHLATTAVAGGNATVRMTVDSAGSVGIGTASPAGGSRLHVSGGAVYNEGSNAGYLFYDRVQSTGYGVLYRTGGVNRLYDNTAGDVLAYTPTGRVGIGTTTPGYTLDVAGQAHATGFPTSSDIRLKTLLVPLTGVLEKLDRIQPVQFDWNDAYKKLGRASGHREIGVVAQEVEVVFPELVSRWGAEGYRAVDYSRLTAVLVEAVKELKAENAELKERVETLERNQGADPAR